MTNATLTLQNVKGSTNGIELNERTSINGKTYRSSFAEQMNGKTEIQLNGEDFVLLGLNSPNPRFKPNNRIGMGMQNIMAYKKPEEKEGANEFNEMSGSLLASLFFAVLPGGHMLEQLKHAVEMSSKLTEESGTKIGIKVSATNVNPVDAINPNKAFLPMTPFYNPKPSPMESLWTQSRRNAIDLADKEKKKKRERANRGLSM